uniref:PB1 domain-containing protein n=1 Tax=Aegilops tauschii subsp. strangulata TaxID=200361 RepID=A0A453LVS3_AEGTS
MLISITSDDDLRHMIDECIVLEENREMINMYLFSRKDDERHVRFVVQGSSDAEKEAQFIALVNGIITTPGYEPRAHSVGRSSANDLDQLMFGISVEAGPPAGRTEEASVLIKSKPLQSIAVPPVTASGQLERTPPSTQRRMINQYYKAQGNEEIMISAARKTSKASPGASAPSESTVQHQQTATDTYRTTGAQEKISPRKQLQIPLDNSSVTTQPSNSLRRNTNFQPHNRVEISEPSHESTSPGGGNISANLQYPERSAATNSIQKNQPAGPATSLDTIQERPSSPTTDEHASEITRFRSVGTGIINPQIRAPLHEAEDNAAPSIPEAEVCHHICTPCFIWYNLMERLTI